MPSADPATKAKGACTAEMMPSDLPPNHDCWAAGTLAAQAWFLTKLTSE
jgi:hypothetical protein